MHKVKTTIASVCGPYAVLNYKQQVGETPQHANSFIHSHTHTPFTGATMHRNTHVTTSINTSHYEYCFQREAIHGIKTSTRVTPLARMKKLKMGGGRGASRLRMRDPLTVHRSAQEFLHTSCHIHCVIQVKVPIVVKDRVRAWEGERRERREKLSEAMMSSPRHPASSS